jgi:undecaprenyl-phosphate 4-deoxy-4-formamido-L-arabinose transferase
MSRVELVSVLVPVFDEEGQVEELIERTLAACRGMDRPFELVLVDDGSRDGSLKLVEAAIARTEDDVRCVVLNRNYGQHAAIMAGLAETRGDLVVTLDADLQNPPEEIPRLVAEAEKGYDVVGTVRVDREDSLFRRLSSALVNRMVQRATGVRMHDYGCMLRAYRRGVVEAMLRCTEHSTFIPILANGFARNTTEIEVRHAARPGGRSKYDLWKLVNLQFDLLTSMTTFPLRLLSILGVVAFLGGVGLGALLLLLRLVHGAEWAGEGVFTLFAVLFTFVGALFLGLGLLGEYIGRIYADVRGRPRSVVERVVARRSRGGVLHPAAARGVAGPREPGVPARTRGTT